MPVNRIVTRGFGVSRGLAGRAGPVTLGYGGPPPAVVAAIRRGFARGQSGTKRRLSELHEVVVWAKLVELNRRPPLRDVSGFIKVRTEERVPAKVIVEHMSSQVKRAWEGFKIIVRRIK